MTTSEKTVLTEGLAQIADIANNLAAILRKMIPDDTPPEPEKEYTYEEARAILAEKARIGFRAEIRAILSRYGETNLSDVKDPKKLAAIVAEAEAIDTD